MRSKICGLKLLKLKKKKKKVALYGKRFLEILPCLTSYTKINSKWVAGLQQNKMLLAGNAGVHVYDARIVKGFLNKTQKRYL